MSGPKGPGVAGRGTLILTVGLPYAGKSTWAIGTGHPVVSPDAIRRALHGERFLDTAEPWVWLHVRTMVAALFGAGHELVIVDATHTTRKRRDEWREWSRRPNPLGGLGGIQVLLHVLATSPAECIDRAQRANDIDILPVIRRMRDQYEPPGEGEGIWVYRHSLSAVDAVMGQADANAAAPYRGPVPVSELRAARDREVL